MSTTIFWSVYSFDSVDQCGFIKKCFIQKCFRKENQNLNCNDQPQVILLLFQEFLWDDLYWSHKKIAQGEKKEKMHKAEDSIAFVFHPTFPTY